MTSYQFRCSSVSRWDVDYAICTMKEVTTFPKSCDPWELLNKAPSFLCLETDEVVQLFYGQLKETPMSMRSSAGRMSLE